MIAYGRGGGAALEFAGLSCGRLAVPVTAARFDLTFAFTETGAALSGDLIYSTDLFDRVTAGGWPGTSSRCWRRWPGGPASRCRCWRWSVLMSGIS